MIYYQDGHHRFVPNFSKYRHNSLNLKVEINHGNRYVCKLNKHEFCGTCQIKQCHANHNINEANCLYIYYPEKDEFDKYDIMYAFDINEKKLRDRIIAGRAQVYNTILLSNILTRLRNNDKIKHCEYCGVLRTSVGPCLNKIECSKRSIFARKFIINSRLKYPELKAKFKDVWLLLYNKEKLLEFVTTNNNSNDNNNIITVNELLGVENEILEESNFLRTFV